MQLRKYLVFYKVIERYWSSNLDKWCIKESSSNNIIGVKAPGIREAKDFIYNNFIYGEDKRNEINKIIDVTDMDFADIEAMEENERMLFVINDKSEKSLAYRWKEDTKDENMKLYTDVIDRRLKFVF